MNTALPVHDTFEIEKRYSAAPAAVYQAFAEREKKRRWYAESPSHEQLAYSLDFRVDGGEELTARMLPGTPIAGATLRWSSLYAEIVPNERIVFFQTLDVDQRRVSGALITVLISPDAGGTCVRLTHQAVYFEGADGPEIRKMGWEHLLESIAGTVGQA